MIDNDVIRRMTPDQFAVHRRALFFIGSGQPLPPSLASELSAVGIDPGQYKPEPKESKR